jgi:hypothetical protein
MVTTGATVAGVVTSPAKRKGDRAEREAVAMLTELGVDAHRRYGAGVVDDLGDLVLVDGLVVAQVRDWSDFGRACAEAACDAERQAATSGAPIGIGIVRRRGGRFLITMTPATFAWVAHALLSDPG